MGSGVQSPDILPFYHSYQFKKITTFHSKWESGWHEAGILSQLPGFDSHPGKTAKK